MAITRAEVLETLKLFLEDKVPQERVYEWALAKVVAKDYDSAANNDLLLHETMQALIDINRGDLEFVPTRKDLEYYFLCLSGQKPFVSFSVRRQEIKKRSQQQQIQKLKAVPTALKASLTQRWLSIDKKIFCAVAKIYVSLFAIVSLAVNVLGIFRPELFRPDHRVDHLQAFAESLPHLLYAALLLLPRRILTRGILFYITLGVFFAAMIFYWYVIIVLVARFDLNIFLFMLFAPFAGFPALLAVWLLWKEKKDSLKL
mgnify:CR=1 FL=1